MEGERVILEGQQVIPEAEGVVPEVQLVIPEGEGVIPETSVRLILTAFFFLMSGFDEGNLVHGKDCLVA